MLADQVNAILSEKSEDVLVTIAQRAGRKLADGGLRQSERQLIETIVRRLAADSIELVRQELSREVRHAKFLPRDIALKIAHDIDSVACPFLEVTEVFSDEDWKQLVLTISRGALIAVARRPSMSEELAVGIAELGDTIAAETLVSNQAAPMTARVCLPLMDRFRTSPWVLENMAERSDLGAEIAVKLTGMVSRLVSKKLSERYHLDDHVAPLVDEAEIASIIRLARNLPTSRHAVIATTLKEKGRLTPHFLRQLLQDGPLAFFEATLSTLSGLPIDRVAGIIQLENPEAVRKLLHKARIPDSVLEELTYLVLEMRRRRLAG